MKIIVTSGGTSEKIDQVRKITNMSTGRLGSLIAEVCAKNLGAHVVYICGKGARKPVDFNGCILEIESVEELREALKKELKSGKCDAVIHAMAVSDYGKHSVMTLDELSRTAALEITNAKDGKNIEELSALVREAILRRSSDGEKKISSKGSHLVMVMKRTPKIIGMIKELQPDTVLFGFKLLVDVPDEQLMTVALALLKENGCDYVVANDLTKVSESGHSAMLLDAGGIIQRMQTKEEIASVISQTILNRMK